MPWHRACREDSRPGREGTEEFARFDRERPERRERYRRERQERRAAHDEALAAARSAGVGKTREQIREIYAAELRARGLPVPSDLQLDAYAEMIARNSPKMSVGFAARVLAEMGKEFMDLISKDPWWE